MCVNCLFADALGALLTDQSRRGVDQRRFLQSSLACAAIVAPPFSLSSAAATAPGGADRASMIFHNGKVYTLDAARPWAQAVAVAGDTIVAVGSDATSSRSPGRRRK